MQKQKLLNSAKFAINRLVYKQTGPEYRQNVQAAHEQLVEAMGELPKAATGTDAEFKTAQKKFNKAEKELAVAEKLLKSGAEAEKKERSPKECLRITRDFLNKNNLNEAGLKKYLGLAENAGDADFVKKLQEKQAALGFKGDDADGIFGKNTYKEMLKDKAFVATFANVELAKIDSQTDKREPLPGGIKSAIETRLSNISDAIQMNYKTVADLHGKLFNADGTFIQPTNATDLIGYKAALDNISGQLKAVNKIGDRLGEYKIPDNFMLTITNQSGDTTTPRILRCNVHNKFSVPKTGLFAVDESRGATNFKAYGLMQENFEKRLAELKGDYDHAVQDWAQKLAGKEGLTGDDASIAKFDEIFSTEHVPPVLALLGKKTEDFQADVISDTGTILAERKAAKDKQLAQNP